MIDWIIVAARWAAEHRTEISIAVWAVFFASIYWMLRQTVRNFKKGLR